MKIVRLNDPEKINSYLQKNKPLHIYGIGDLDEFFWDHTTWYGFEDDQAIKAIILLYTGLSVPTLLVLSENIEPLRSLLEEVVPILPDRMYLHLSPGLVDIIERTFNVASYGDHFKMSTVGLNETIDTDHPLIKRLEPSDIDEILRFYEVSYPGNWFDVRMLESGHYFGLRLNDTLVSISGIHVYSPKYRVAALGNIATNPEYRGKGYGKLVTMRCCQSLFETVDIIGLNVKVDNTPAVAIYRKLGFEIAGVYGEYMAERK